MSGPAIDEPHAMQWDGSEQTVLDVHDEMQDARSIVAWVNANGGEARYGNLSVQFPPDWRIAVRTRRGWAYCAPGQRVVMGAEIRTSGPSAPFREFTVADA